MNEVRIAHFRHRHEADLAQGFLDDADIPSRLLSDNAAGGVSYIGGLAGAWVIVREADVEFATEVLESAGIRMGPEEPSGPAVDLARRAGSLSPVARSELDDLNEALEKAQKDQLKHSVFCLLGFTPAALIPLAGLAAQGEMALIVLLTVLVFLTEGWKAVKAGRVVKELEASLSKLEEETRDQ